MVLAPCCAIKSGTFLGKKSLDEEYLDEECFDNSFKS